ncbi:amidase domain-containing protein [Spirillospora sp. NPDC127200]
MAADLTLDDSLTETPALAAKIDLSDQVRNWRQLPDQNDGVVLKAPQGSRERVYGGGTPLSVTVGYLPATTPTAPEALTVRAGDGGAMLQWGTPKNPGTAAPAIRETDEETRDSAIESYQVEALGADGQVVKRATVAHPSAMLSGLANGVAHRFRARAENSEGWGPWTAEAAATPTAVPGGVALFRSAVERYLKERERISETGQGPAAPTDGVDTGSILRAQQEELLATRAFAAEGNAGQVRSSITVPEALAIHLPDEGRVVVRARLDGSITYGENIGTPEAAETTSPVTTTEEFVFDIPGTGTAARALTASPNAPTLTGAYTASVFARNEGATSEVNAYTPEQEKETGDTAPEATLPLEGPGPQPQGEAKAPASSPALAASSRGIAAWASRNNNYSGIWEYGNDCANFVSKAISWGGGYREIGGGRKSNSAWWKRAWRYNTYSWSAVRNHHDHFQNRRGRVTWRWTYADVRVGDIIYFSTSKNPLFHMGVVTRKTGNNARQIYYSHHGGYPTYNKPLYKAGANAGFGLVRW